MPTWHTEVKRTNVSSERIKKFPLYSLVIDSKVASILRRLLIPRNIRNIIKRQLVMQERPTLSDEKVEYLTELFNRDLRQLSAQLNHSLDCNNFKEITKSHTLEWR